MNQCAGRTALLLGAAAWRASAAETVLVERGRIGLAVAPAECVWRTGDGFIEGTRQGRTVSTIYADRKTGPGDFRARARLATGEAGRGAELDLPDLGAQLVLDARAAGGGSELNARGGWFGTSRGPVAGTAGLVPQGRPFAFEVVRKGARVSFLVEGREALAVDAGGADLGRIGFRGQGIRVFDFTIEGATGEPPGLPPARAMTENEIKLLSYPAKLAQPLAYGKDLVEVTTEGTLRRRYRVWGDWDAEVRAYLDEARGKSMARGSPPRKVTMGCVFLEDARITLTQYKGGDGKPLRGVYTTPPSFAEAMRERGMKGYSDFMFAFSGGELEVEWVVETLRGMSWVQDQKTLSWGCQPKALGEQVVKALERHSDAGVCMWMFCAGKPETLNPDPADPKMRIGGPPYGISYTQWPLHGGYTLVVCAPDVGLMVHEFNHRYLDGLAEQEGIKLTMFHGLAMLGLEPSDLGYPHLLNTYRSVYLYVIRRDMWRRFTITERNETPAEPFTGRAYAWDEVKHDCWFRLPALGNAELARLTGIASLEMDARLKARYRLYRAGEADRANVLSPHVTEGGETDVALDNLLALPKESAAVLATATGHWLFVRPDLADVYVDMLRISGRSDEPLPAYGYVLEGVRPLVVLRAPPDVPVPSSEIGYFRERDPVRNQ